MVTNWTGPDHFDSRKFLPPCALNQGSNPTRKATGARFLSFAFTLQSFSTRGTLNSSPLVRNFLSKQVLFPLSPLSDLRAHFDLANSPYSSSSTSFPNTNSFSHQQQPLVSTLPLPILINPLSSSLPPNLAPNLPSPLHHPHIHFPDRTKRLRDSFPTAKHKS